jgi:soluble P-type ATPase
VYGFLAEEVLDVFPEAVNNKNSELIPNIYLMGSAEGDVLKIAKELELNIEYTCYLSDKTEKIIILEDLGDGDYKINKTYETKTDIFVYGKIDNAFHILKKEYMHAVTISAVQELHRTITRQQDKINDLETRLARLEAYMLGNI